MGRDSRGHYIKINSLLFPWRRYGRAYKSTQTPEGRRRRERRRRLQALWRVHTNHPHFNVKEYDNDDKRGGGGEEEEEGQWCVHGVPRDRGCMLGIRRRGHYKELWGPASYVQHPCPPLASHYRTPFYRLLSLSSPPPLDLRGGSLYTRSVPVLNVLSLLMPRSACPRGRSTVHFCLPSSFSCPDIELYTPYLSLKILVEEERERIELPSLPQTFISNLYTSLHS